MWTAAATSGSPTSSPRSTSSSRAGRRPSADNALLRLRPHHLLRVDEPVEVLLLHVPERDRGLLQGRLLLVRLLRDLRRLVVADVAVWRRADHERGPGRPRR